VRLLFQKAIKRSILEIFELESERTRVTSQEGKEFSPDCKVKIGIVDDSGTIEVYLV